MGVDYKSACELLVGFGTEVRILSVEKTDDLIIVTVETVARNGGCVECGKLAGLKDRLAVTYVDLPCYGRSTRLVWLKRRWRCEDTSCDVRTWTEQNDQIAYPRQLLTTRAGRWVTHQVGKHGRTVAEVAADLSCDWHTVNDTVVAYGEALLEADTGRINGTNAVGLDETLFNKTGEYHRKNWCTSIVNIINGKLLDIIEDRTAVAVCGWFKEQSESWISSVRYGTLDMSGSYRKVFDTSLPDATQIVDPFHLIKHAGSKVDECRCRIQNETLGHRGRKKDPLYRARMLLLKGDERHDQNSRTKLESFLEAGDPNGELRVCWLAKEAIRDLYKIKDPKEGEQYVQSLIDTFKHKDRPPEVKSLGRTLKKWFNQITAWHRNHLSNGPTEGINNLIKRIKRIGFGYRNFRNYKIRNLLYSGQPNWNLLEHVTPTQIR